MAGFDGETAVQWAKQNLREGCRVELTGLSSEDLNGQHGSISGSYLAYRGRWPVVVDGTGRKLSCKPTNLKASSTATVSTRPQMTKPRRLASCGHCGAEKVLGALKRCTRCRAAHYCNSDCQRAHWTLGGHQEACREQFACTICLDDGEDPLPIQCGCACRDAAGCAHIACKVEYAKHQGLGYHDDWYSCPTCKQDYTGAMQLRLAEALCQRLKGRSAEAEDDLFAQSNLAGAYERAGRFAEANALQQELLATRRRVFGPNHAETLVVAGSLGTTLLSQGKDVEAEAVYRDTLERQRELLGPEHEHTLGTSSSLATALQNQGKFAEAEPVLRDTLAIQERVLGEGHTSTLNTDNGLAVLLVNTGKHAEAEGLCRIGLAHATRTLGPEHPASLAMARTLAITLGKQGQTTEAAALLAATLATQQRVMGPEHPDVQDTAQMLRCYSGKV